MEFENVTDLAAKLTQDQANLIGIDGIDGSGKTTLARSISELTGHPVIHLDDFIIPDQGGFLAGLNIPAINSAIKQNSSLIIEGVCLLSVARKLQLDLDALIYVKRMHHGVWSDERECNIEADLECFLAREREVLELIEPGGGDTLGLAEELIPYHFHFRPHEAATHTFLRPV